MTTEWAELQSNKAPTALRLADIEPDLILAFLDHLEQQRQNAVRSRNRNLRLTTLRAFLKFAARRDATCRRSMSSSGRWACR